MTSYELHLNFLTVLGDIPLLTVYRRERAPNEKADQEGGIFAYELPEALGDAGERKSYLVSLKPAQGFSEFKVSAGTKIDLTRRVILEALRVRCAQACQADEFHIPDGSFIKEVEFRVATHAEGEERIALRPYYLGATRQFGFLVDFHFHKEHDVPFNRRIQQLSGSLDAGFRRNLDYYAFRLGKIRGWIQRYHRRLFPLPLPGTDKALSIASDFLPLPARQLRPKTYIVGNRREHRSQFVGVKEAGPLESPAKCPPLMFIFREPDREAARRLARALKGSEPQLNFPGFEKLFHLPLSIAGAVEVQDFSRSEMERALKHLQAPDGSVAQIPVVVMPKDEDAYATHKAVFTHAGVATQVCTTETISDDYALKWSVANIALQLFCKAGGNPWKVKPTDDSSLIVGISQSHKVVGDENDRRVEKYFAFSVLTDSSGLFQSLNVIGQSEKQADYLKELAKNLAVLLREQATRFSKVVLHTSFKLKRAEMEVIENVVSAAAAESKKCKFAVVKVNQKNRFFAVNRAVNSLVPYEASYLQLGSREYLLWFEGVFPDKPNVKKAFPGPTHLEFLKVSEQPLIGETQILQDLVNLSGANWRGFNAKSAPVSVFYCHIVAELLCHFHERNLPLPEVKDLRPWFL